MAFDLKAEIFAYQWFHPLFSKTGLLSGTYDVTELYYDECLVDPECIKVNDSNDVNSVIEFRRWMFGKLYLEVIESQIDEFRHSQTDFYCYVLRTCNRTDLFGNLTVFERVLATCAFVSFLCVYCCVNYNPEIMRYGYICWAIYFDKFSDEFYQKGGWNQLQSVAASYNPAICFLFATGEVHGPTALMKTKKAIESYNRFRKIGKIDYEKCTSLSWIKFHIQYLNESFDIIPDDQFADATDSDEVSNYSEVENILKQMKYLCDPTGLESFRCLLSRSMTDSSESSMASVNICDTHVNLDSKEKATLAPNLQQNITSVIVASKSAEKLNTVEEKVLSNRESDKAASTSLEVSSKHNSPVKIRHDSNAKHINKEYFQFKSAEQDVKCDTVEHLLEDTTIPNLKGEKKAIRSSILATQFPSIEKEYNYEIRCDARKERDDRKAKDSTNLVARKPSIKKNAEKESSNKTNQDDKRDENMEKGVERSMSPVGQIPSANKNAKSKSGNKTNQDDVRKGNTEKGVERSVSLAGQILSTKKDAENETSNQSAQNAEEKANEKSTKKIPIPTEEKNADREKINKSKSEKRKKKKGKKKRRDDEISSTVQNAEEENNETKNSIRKEQEDNDVKNFLRMLLVLGDKKGISYVRKTSKF